MLQGNQRSLCATLGVTANDVPDPVEVVVNAGMYIWESLGTWPSPVNQAHQITVARQRTAGVTVTRALTLFGEGTNVSHPEVAGLVKYIGTFIKLDETQVELL